MTNLVVVAIVKSKGRDSATRFDSVTRIFDFQRPLTLNVLKRIHTRGPALSLLDFVKRDFLDYSWSTGV